MSPEALLALCYIRNAYGGATMEAFMEDNAPVGFDLWLELCGIAPLGLALVDLNAENRPVILDAGLMVLAALPATADR